MSPPVLDPQHGGLHEVDPPPSGQLHPVHEDPAPRVRVAGQDAALDDEILLFPGVPNGGLLLSWGQPLKVALDLRCQVWPLMLSFLFSF